MAPGLLWHLEHGAADDSGGGGGDGMINGLDLNSLGMSTLKYRVPCNSELAGETRERKRLKQADESIENQQAFSLYCDRSSTWSFPKPQFRDHVWAFTQKYLAIEAMEIGGGHRNDQEIEVKDDQAADRTGRNTTNGGGDHEMRLVQQLIACAEAVACRDKSHASVLLSDLRANALVFGTAFQRVASCFVQGLAERLALVQPLGTVGVIGRCYPMTSPSVNNNTERDEALQLVYEICPQIQFAHYVANTSIIEAFEGKSLLHIVDLGMTLGLPHGHQWRKLLHTLVNRPGQQPKRLRITAVGTSADRLQSIGDDLRFYAQTLSFPFEFACVERNLETLTSEDIYVREGETLVINCIFQLHCVVKESRGALHSVLLKLQELSPKLFVLVEQDSSHNGPFFLGRFMEALHYYSAIFDSLDATLPRYDTRRAKMEQFYFAEEIKNIISCEGPARVERHERLDQWRRRMSRARFQSVAIKMMGQTKQWLPKINACEGYTVVEEKGCLVLGWKSKPIVAASCWKCL